eukprot:s336_g23.t1
MVQLPFTGRKPSRTDVRSRQSVRHATVQGAEHIIKVSGLNWECYSEQFESPNQLGIQRTFETQPESTVLHAISKK